MPLTRLLSDGIVLQSARAQALDELLATPPGAALSAYRLGGAHEAGGQLLLQSAGLLMLRHVGSNPVLLHWQHDDELLLAFASPARALFLQGRHWPHERQPVLTGRQRAFLLLPAGCDTLLVFLSCELLRERFGADAAQRLFDCAMQLQQGRGCCPDQQWMTAAVMESFMRLGHVAAQGHAAGSRAVLADLLCCLYWHVSAVFDTRPLAAHNHGRIVRQVLELVLQEAQTDRSLDELCAVACCSRRTLANAFHEVLDLPPMKLLRLVRLNAFREDLHGLAGPHELVALMDRYGYTNASRLNASYRDLFSERPRDALQRQLQRRRTQAAAALAPA